MAAAAETPANSRERLALAIVEEIRAWPQRPRQIFTRVHYGGMSIEEVALYLELSALEVRQVLALYEQKLRAALKTFSHSNGNGNGG
jgi:DNA-directed RNA polymerase specialized sigma24 family protein